MCVLSKKVPIRNKSGNLFNDPRTRKNNFFKYYWLVYFFFNFYQNCYLGLKCKDYNLCIGVTPLLPHPKNVLTDYPTKPHPWIYFLLSWLTNTRINSPSFINTHTILLWLIFSSRNQTGRSVLLVVLTFLFCYMFSSTYFLFFRVFFLVPKRPQHFTYKEFREKN